MTEEMIANTQEEQLDIEEVVESSEESADENDGIEDKARRMGWKDKSEFDNPSKSWVDAGTFVKRAEEEQGLATSACRCRSRCRLPGNALGHEGKQLRRSDG